MNFKSASLDHSKNFWQLASMLGPALGLPAMIIGGQLAKEYGAGAACTSIWIGNFVLWLIGLGIISMSDGKNAIENIRNYMGKMSAVIAALVTVFAFIIWFALQVRSSSVALCTVMQNSNQLQTGMILGFLVTILSIWGLRATNFICIFALPFLICLAMIEMFNSDLLNISNLTLNFSFYGVVTVVLIWLPGAVNLPTFFRHSRSRADSILALSLLTGFHIFFQTFTVLSGIDNPIIFITKFVSSEFSYFATLALFCFIFAAYLCINLVNIYYASAGWEAIFPHHRNSKEYAIVGFTGTFVYILSQITSHANPLQLTIATLEIIATSFIVSLGIVLIIDFIVKLVVKHRPRPYEKLLSSLCWFIGCITSSRFLLKYTSSPQEALLTGIGASVLAFLLVIFIEETIWSINKIDIHSLRK